MAIAKLADIVEVHPAVRRITGSSDIPLSKEGKQQAAEIGARLKGKFTKVFSSPMKRAMDTARAIDPKAEPDHFLGPARLGRHESRPSEEAQPEVTETWTKKPFDYPGKSPFSGKQGETFDSFRRRMLGRVQGQLAHKKPGDVVLDMTHGRNIRLVHAWMKAGMPKNLSIDMATMTEPGDKTPPGDLLKVDTEKKELVEMRQPNGDGLYIGRHAGTHWSEQGGATS